MSNIWKKFLAKREEKKDFEKFLCTIKDPTPCKKIPWWGFIVSFIRDLFPRRTFKIDENYSWKDWIETQEGVITYKQKIKTLTKNE